ncbi:MAG: nucleoside phosphorylase [Spirochaetia bacterium]|jgi:uridine phosphorylase|nr:nucleoside phosphorylase [Spirochaetia bacterium]
MEYISADKPFFNGLMPHLKCKKGDIAKIVLLPGDPKRVMKFASLCDNFEIISSNREFTVGTGTYKNVRLSVCSTGIGSASTEIVVQELMYLGAEVLIRTGGTGAVQKGIECGDLIINTGAMRLGGASSFYVRPEYPAIASFEVVKALKETCEENNVRYHMGICASVGSFYKGQGRKIVGKETSDTDLIKYYEDLNIKNLEMESETVLTLASLNNIYAGSICVVHCNRIEDKWLVDFEDAQLKMCKTTLEAVVKINSYLQGEKL